MAKLPPAAITFSYWVENVVLLGAATEELIESFFGLFFGGDLVYSLEDHQRRLLGNILDLWHLANHSPSLTAQSRADRKSVV